MNGVRPPLDTFGSMGGGHAIHQMGEGKKADMRIKVIGQIMPVMARLTKKKCYVEV